MQKHVVKRAIKRVCVCVCFSLRCDLARNSFEMHSKELVCMSRLHLSECVCIYVSVCAYVCVLRSEECVSETLVFLHVRIYVCSCSCVLVVNNV